MWLFLRTPVLANTNAPTKQKRNWVGIFFYILCSFKKGHPPSHGPNFTASPPPIFSLSATGKLFSPVGCYRLLWIWVSSTMCPNVQNEERNKFHISETKLDRFWCVQHWHNTFQGQIPNYKYYKKSLSISTQNASPWGGFQPTKKYLGGITWGGGAIFFRFFFCKWHILVPVGLRSFWILICIPSCQELQSPSPLILPPSSHLYCSACFCYPSPFSLSLLSLGLCAFTK